MNIRELLIRIGVDTVDSGDEVDRLDDKVNKVKGSLTGLGTLLTTIFAGGALRALAATADQMQNIQSRIGAASGDIAGANAQLNELAQHANQNRMGIDAYADSWAKFETGMLRMGKTSEDTTALVDGLSAAFRVNGTEGNTAADALFQLTQSISGGTVQMEELNSLMDAQGNLYVTVAEDIGGTTTAFKKMVSQGKVTSEMLANSIIKNTKKYIDQLKEMPMTLGDVWTVVTNDFKVGINNFNDSVKFIPTLARELMDVWKRLKQGIKEFTDQFGTLDELTDHLKNVLTPLAALLGILLAFKALTVLTSPIALVLQLAAAIGLLYDDYQTWKNGGESLIDWSEWEGPINDTLVALHDLTQGFKDLTKAAADALGIDFSKWTLKGELEDLSYHMRELVYMGKQLGDVLNGLADFDFKKVGGALKNLWKQGDPDSEMPARDSGFAPDAPAPERPKPLYRRPDWWPEVLGGRGELMNPESAVPLAPGNVPSNVVNTRNQTINAPVKATINVTQQPGEDGDALAQRITSELKKQTAPGGWDAHYLEMAGGAK